jgi:hypothetical protein
MFSTMFSGVSFVAESCQLEGAGISIPGSPKNVPLSSILESGTVFEMAACKTGRTGRTATSSLVQFPHLFLKRAYDDYCGEIVHQRHLVLLILADGTILCHLFFFWNRLGPKNHTPVHDAIGVRMCM